MNSSGPRIKLSGTPLDTGKGVDMVPPAETDWYLSERQVFIVYYCVSFYKVYHGLQSLTLLNGPEVPEV